MQEKTKLEVEIFKAETYKKAQRDWHTQDEKANGAGMYGSSSHILLILDIGFKYIDELLNKLLEAEKTALTKTSNLSADYFVVLTDEVLRLFEYECNLIRSKAVQQFKQDQNAQKLIFSQAGEYLTGKKDLIIKQIKLLEHENKISDFNNNSYPLEVNEMPTFEFIQIQKLRPILKRDYNEIIKGIKSGCCKSAVILSGSSIEAILYDSLKQNETTALSTSSAPRSKGKVLPLEEWRLNSLIDTAWNLKLVTKSVTALNHSVKEFRNLVHPTEEIKDNYKIEKEEAENAFTILKTLIRDLQQKSS